MRIWDTPWRILIPLEKKKNKDGDRYNPALICLMPFKEKLHPFTSGRDTKSSKVNYHFSVQEKSLENIMWKLIWHASVKFQISGMSKWVQFSFNCFWTPCVEKKTTEWQLLIQNANLWHGTVKMACHSQKAGVCYASHFSSVHATCPCIRQPLAFAFGTFLRGTVNMTQQNV